MNSWRSRISVCLLFLLAVEVHSVATAFLPNTPVGMLIFHGSAFTVDLLLLWSVPFYLCGCLCTATQTLCLISIAANFMGWLAYLAYVPPVFYNTFMWGLCYVQWVIILFMDRDDAYSLGFDLVRGGIRRRSQIYS